jgi:hypothetical protein
MKLKRKDDDEEKMPFHAKGPSIHYVSTFLEKNLSHPSTMSA